MKYSIALIFILIFSFSAFSQNKFEGFNIIVDAPETQRQTACAIRYASPSNAVTITDIDRGTPMKVMGCGDSASSLRMLNASSASINANPASGKWCFQGEDKRYRITFNGDQYTSQVSYDWIANTADEGTYNIKDFGAAGDGITDDTIALRSALAFIATRNGGTLKIPRGDFLIGNIPGFKGLTLPSGVVIQGASGLSSGAPTNNVVQKAPSRITLNGTNRAIFRIGECTERVAIRDVELYANSFENTYGVEAVGGYNSSQDFEFSGMSFNNFFRGIYVRGLESTAYEWQFDYIKVVNTRFTYNRDAGIYCRTKNADWNIKGSFFLVPPRNATSNANAMYFYHSALVLVEQTFGGGFAGARGGDFISIIDGTAFTVINSQCESMTRSVVYGDLPGAGDYSYPIVFSGNIFGDPMEFKARRTFVSQGNSYGGNTFRADERLRVYSMGDRFCYDGWIIGCQGAAKNNFDKATIIFMTGQPTEGSVQGHPTFFGTDVQFGQPPQMPSFQQNQMPAGKPNGSMIYCSNCRRNSTPCQGGGSGAPAMMVGGNWSCL